MAERAWDASPCGRPRGVRQHLLGHCPCSVPPPSPFTPHPPVAIAGDWRNDGRAAVGRCAREPSPVFVGPREQQEQIPGRSESLFRTRGLPARPHLWKLLCASLGREDSHSGSSSRTQGRVQCSCPRGLCPPRQLPSLPRHCLVEAARTQPPSRGPG